MASLIYVFAKQFTAQCLPALQKLDNYLVIKLYENDYGGYLTKLHLGYYQSVVDLKFLHDE